MVGLEQTIQKLDERHKTALRWFHANRGRTVLWQDLQDLSTSGPRLVNQAKGIYKPAYTEYALSVRTLQDGPYPDKDVEYRADGTWACQYFQENPDPSKRDREATNRGLVQCMEDGIPVGFLIKRKPKPGVTYEVLGLGYVVEWSDGYFTIEGLKEDGSAHNDRDATRARAVHGVNASEEAFDASDDADRREKTMQAIAVRRGQATFRAKLLEAYGGRCCVTGCDLKDALEAAHISPYRGEHSNHAQNGLLLRSDMHTLFDLGLFAVDESYRLILAPQLHKSEAYRDFSGKRLLLPSDENLQPSRGALAKHRAWSGL